MLRTHNCGELRQQDIGKKVTLAGWVQTIRNKGSLLWLDLRDAYGITQIVLDKKTAPEVWDVAKQLGKEYVIGATGTIALRKTPNPEIATGKIELLPTSLTLYSPSKIPPFLIKDKTDGSEALRMRYRYLDLRRPLVQKRLKLREQVIKLTRSFFSSQQFKEIETPLLIKSTPEGARDFVIPSRLHKGYFYALPQSPQLFKQLLMVGGVDRYFQLAKSFRDEDFRADRQPEFTQIDCEMSFVTLSDVLNTIEAFIQYILEKIKGKKQPEFERISYQEALLRYGTDKPDLRFSMPILPLESIIQQQGCALLDHCESVRGLLLPGAATWSRKKLSLFWESLSQDKEKIKGPFWLKKNQEGALSCSLAKFFDAALQEKIASTVKCQAGDLLFFIGGPQENVLTALGSARKKAGELLKLYDPSDISPLWVLDFPLLSWDANTQHYNAMHHPFTAYHPEDQSLLKKNPGAVRAQAYDLVINGIELGSGSIRCHNPIVQKEVLNHLGLSEKEIEAQFGFFLEALHYGTPPHGGMGIGLGRLCTILEEGDRSNVRDFIAFPKNSMGRDMMLDTPSPLNPVQMKELHLSREN